MIDASAIRLKMCFQTPASTEGTELGYATAWLGDLLGDCPASQATIRLSGFWPLLLQWHPSPKASPTFSIRLKKNHLPQHSPCLPLAWWCAISSVLPAFAQCHAAPSPWVQTASKQLFPTVSLFGHFHPDVFQLPENTCLESVTLL